MNLKNIENLNDTQIIDLQGLNNYDNHNITNNGLQHKNSDAHENTDFNRKECYFVLELVENLEQNQEINKKDIQYQKNCQKNEQQISNNEFNNQLQEKNKKIERKLSEKQIQNKEFSIMDIQKYKKNLMASVFHEIKTPLNSATLMINILKENKEIGQEIQDSIIFPLFCSIELLNSVVFDLTDMFQLELGQYQLNINQFNLVELVQQCVLLFLPLSYQKKILIKTDFMNIENFSLYSDLQRVKQILINLLTNAFKYTQVGGQIDVCMKFNEQSGLTSISIQDNGCGMDENQINKILQSNNIDKNNMYAKKGQQRGIGIGLRFCQQLATKLNQKDQGLLIQSELGHGTCITFFLQDKHKNGQQIFQKKILMFSDEFMEQWVQFTNDIQSDSKSNFSSSKLLKQFQQINTPIQKQKKQQQKQFPSTQGNILQQQFPSNKNIYTHLNQDRFYQYSQNIQNMNIKNNTSYNNTPTQMCDQIKNNLAHKSLLTQNIHNQQKRQSSEFFFDFFKGKCQSAFSFKQLGELQSYNSKINKKNGKNQLKNQNTLQSLNKQINLIDQQQYKITSFENLFKENTNLREKQNKLNKNDIIENDEFFISCTDIISCDQSAKMDHKIKDFKINSLKIYQFQDNVSENCKSSYNEYNQNNKNQKYFIEQINQVQNSKLSENYSGKEKSQKNYESHISQKFDSISLLYPILTQEKNKKSNFSQCKISSQQQMSNNNSHNYFSQNGENEENFHEDINKLQNEQYHENCVCSKILLVDDDLFNINSIQMIFKTRYKLFCDTAYNGLEAFELVESKQDKDNICKNGCDQHYKLIIMDIDMPIMDGIQSAQKIYNFYQKNNQMQNYPQIISHTAYDLDNNLQELHQQKIFKQSLSKPIALIELDNLINNQDFLNEVF